jgi:hypothetical protein
MTLRLAIGLLLAATVTPAMAQFAPPPGMAGPIIPGMGGNPNIYGNQFAHDYNTYGEDYARRHSEQPSYYQPYPTATPTIRSFDYGPSSSRHNPYSLEDND